MDTVIELLKTLNSLSPLAVIALLALVIYKQVQAHKLTTTIKTNDLHEMPDLVAAVKTLSDSLQRIEVAQSSAFAAILARLDDGRRK